MLSLTVGTFEDVWTQFAFFDFKMQRINFVIHFTAPSEFVMIF